MSNFFQQLLFYPGLPGLLGNPFYLNRSALYRFIAAQSERLQGRVLDVGCGVCPYRHLFPNAAYVGLEYDTPVARERNLADRYYSGTSLPCDDGEFDAVLATEVLEHVFFPDAFLAEINRSLRVGGVLVLTVPFLWDEHEQPHDYARYTSFALEHLLVQHGFEIVDRKKLNVGVVALVQLINNCIYKLMYVNRRRYRFLLAALFCLPGTLSGILLRLIVRWPEDIYSNNGMVAIKRAGGGSAFAKNSCAE